MNKTIFYLVVLTSLTVLFATCKPEEHEKQSDGTEEQSTAVKEPTKKAAKGKRGGESKADDPSETGSVTHHKILSMVNNTRAKGCKCGGKYYPPVPPLRWNNQLERAAKKHSNYMSRKNRLSHTGRGGSDPGKRMKAEGYNWMAYGENVAMGYANEKEAMNGWINSKGHCKNIMSAKFKEMGVGRSGEYWTQNFGAK